MQNRRRFVQTFLFSLLFILFLGQLYSQEMHFTQTLEWIEDEYAFEYRVEIKNQDTGKVQNIKTEDCFVTLSLEPGNYRYRVYAIDFLGKDDSVSDWRDFTVVKAKTPKVEELKENVVLSEENKKDFSIPVDVTSITAETSVVLINTKTNEQIKGSLKIVTSGEEAIASNAVFPEVKEGSWKMKITNPSGLYSETESIDITKTTEKAIEIVQKEPEEKRAAPEIMAAAKKQENEQLAQQKQKAEEERLERERLARLEEERLKKERLALEEELKKAEQERLAKEAAQKAEQERLAMEEVRREEQERLEQERLAQLEAERLEKAEQERLAKEAAQKAEQEQERLEQEAAQREEEQRLEQERLAHEDAQREEEKRLAKEERKNKRQEHKYQDIYIEAGADGLLSIYDGQFAEMTGQNIILGLDAKLAYLPFDFGKNKLGFELDVTGFKYSNTNEYIDLQLPGLISNFQVVYHQNLIKEKLYLGLKAGAGICLLEKRLTYPTGNLQRQIPEDKIYGYIGLKGGISLFINPVNPLIIEIGADINHLFIPEMNTGFVKPYLSFGIRL